VGRKKVELTWRDPRAKP